MSWSRSVVVTAAGALTVGALAPTAVAVAAPAAPAADPVCVVARDQVTVTAPAAAAHLRVVSADGGLFVHVDGVSQASCSGLTTAITRVAMGDTDGSVSTWEFAETAARGVAVEIGNGATDTVRHLGTTSSRSWTALSPTAYSTDGDADAEVSVAQVPALVQLIVAAGGDDIDFAQWTGALTIDGGAIAGPQGGSAFVGGSGPDTITGTAHADTLVGNGGNDTLSPDRSSDVVHPGPGDDTAIADHDAVPDVFASSDGRDTLRMLDAGVYDPTVAGGDGHAGENDDFGAHEVVIGSGGFDRFVAQPGGVEVHGNGGFDRLVSGPGSDSFLGTHVGTVDLSRLAAGAGGEGVVITLSAVQVWQATAPNGSVDTFWFPHTVVGSPGDDVLDVPAYVLVPGPGDDLVGSALAEGGQRIVASATPDGADRAASGVRPTWDYSARTTSVSLSLDGRANDGAPGEGDQLAPGEVIGGRANDVLVGTAEGDSLLGGPGADRLRGRGGNDRLQGQAGNDAFNADLGHDEILGGSGRDTVTFAARTSGVFVTIGYQPDITYPASYHAPIGVERLVGTSYRDTLIGGRGADELLGRGGRDLLRGRGGDDVLRDEDGIAGRLDGGSGRDVGWHDRYDQLISIEVRR